MTASRLVLLALVVTGAVALALPAAARDVATTIEVTVGKPSEFRFTLSKSKVKRGTKVTFVVTNLGTLRHNFRIAGKKTPLLKVGKSVVLDVTFDRPGRYRYLCTMSGHAAAGMQGVLVVQ
jgi:plastocyanin